MRIKAYFTYYTKKLSRKLISYLYSYKGRKKNTMVASITTLISCKLECFVLLNGEDGFWGEMGEVDEGLYHYSSFLSAY